MSIPIPPSLDKVVSAPQAVRRVDDINPGFHARSSNLTLPEGYEPTRTAYLLIKEIYHWFGFDSQVIPYVDKSGAVPKRCHEARGNNLS
jgi:hypothetical protein